MIKIKGEKMLKVVVYQEGDDSFGEIWEIPDRYSKKLDNLLCKEDIEGMHDLIRENGKKIIQKVDYWIRLPDR